MPVVVVVKVVAVVCVAVVGSFVAVVVVVVGILLLAAPVNILNVEGQPSIRFYPPLAVFGLRWGHLQFGV